MYLAAMFRKWLRDSLDRLGPQKSRSGLARHLGRTPAYVTRILDYGQKIPAEILPDIASYLGVPLPSDNAVSDGVVQVRATGVFAMGQWRDQNADVHPIGLSHIPSPPDTRFSGRTQYGMVMATTEISELDVGDYAIVVPRQSTDVLVERQLVHVKTRRDHRIEDTVRRVRRVRGETRLEHDDIGARGRKVKTRPISEDTEIVGIVIGKYRPF